MDEESTIAILWASPPAAERTRALAVVVVASISVLAFVVAGLLEFRVIWLNILVVPFALMLIGLKVMQRLNNYEPLQELEPTAPMIASITSTGVQLPSAIVVWDSMEWISVLVFAGDASVTAGGEHEWTMAERFGVDTRSFRMVLRDPAVAGDPGLAVRRLARRGALGIPSGRAVVVCHVTAGSSEPGFADFMQLLGAEAESRGIPMTVYSY